MNEHLEMLEDQITGRLRHLLLDQLATEASPERAKQEILRRIADLQAGILEPWEQPVELVQVDRTTPPPPLAGNAQDDDAAIKVLGRTLEHHAHRVGLPLRTSGMNE